MELLFAGVGGETLTKEERELFRRIKPAGYVLFSRNIASVGQTRALTDELSALNDFIPLIAIDQEGGRVVRTKALGVELPSPEELSVAGKQAFIKMHAYLTACVLRQLGFNMNFAPVLDIGAAEKTGKALTGRCWGSDVKTVVSNAGVYADTLLRNEILTCGKHFPGLGRAWVDPHHELPVVDASLEDLLVRDVIPFTALGDKGLSAVMCAHVFFPRLDRERLSSLSSRILTGLLRNQLGYEGLIVTDDLDMGAIAENFGVPEASAMAIEAGNDLAMICHSGDKLEACSAAIRGLPYPLLAEREARVSDFLWKKLPARMPFSLKKWEKALNETREFSKQFSGKAPDSKPSSPVHEY